MTRPLVAIATCREVPHLDEDGPALLAALESRGITARPAVWNDETIEWSDFDLVVMRSTWDYVGHYDEFLRWTRRVAQVSDLANPPDVAAWNTDKRYLLELAAADVPVVPTWFSSSAQTLPAFDQVVIKPAISAGCRDTVRRRGADVQEIHRHIDAIVSSGRTAMVQPYLPGIEERGETALLFIGGRYSHAIHKGPLLELDGDVEDELFRRETIAPREPTDAEQEVAHAALEAVPFAEPLLYARVDVVPDQKNQPCVLELELVEPSMFLDYDPEAPTRFADAVVAHLGK